MKTHVVRFNGDQYITAVPGFGQMTYSSASEMKAFLNRRGITQYMVVTNKNARV
jgi:hypothetical protein